MNAPMSPDSADKKPDKKLGVHPDVLRLGLVSFLTDLSSEMIFAVFAIFFTTIAGASAVKAIPRAPSGSMRRATGGCFCSSVAGIVAVP